MPRLIPYEDTTVPVIKTLAEIEELLVLHHASAVMREYESGRIKGLAFKTNTLSFRLPANVEAVYNYLLQKKRDRSRAGRWNAARSPEGQRLVHEQAERCAWRNVLGAVKSGLALVEIGMVKIEEVFLAYALSPDGSQTLYQQLAERHFAALMPAREG